MTIKFKLKQKLEFSFLSVIVIVLQFFFGACGHGRINQIKYDKSSKRFDENYSLTIDTVLRVANACLTYLQDSVKPYISRQFLDSLPLLSDSCCQLKIYISNSEGMYWELDNGVDKNATVFATDYPVQLLLLYGGEFLGNTQMIPPEQAYKIFDTTKAMYLITAKNVVIENLSLKAVRAFKLRDNSAVFLSRLWLSGVDGGSFEYVVNGLGVYTEERTYLRLMQMIPGWFKEWYDFKVKTFYISSEYFRMAVNYPNAFRIAQSIRLKYIEDSLNHTNNYPMYLMRRDDSILREMLIKENIRFSYYQDLFQDVNKTIVAGKFLWSYENYFEFIIQWILIELCALALLTLAIKIDKISVFIKRVLLVTPTAALIWLFKFCWDRMPPGMSLTYLILPIVVIILQIWLVRKYFSSKKRAEP